MFSKERNIESLRQLFLEFKHYVELQKKYIAFATTEKLTLLLSTIAIAIVCMVFIALILLYLTFALAYYLGDLTGSLPLGFACIGSLLLLILLIFYFNRKRWVILPIAHFMVNLFLENNEEDETEQ